MAELDNIEYRLTVMENSLRDAIASMSAETERTKALADETRSRMPEFAEGMKRVEEIAREARDNAKNAEIGINSLRVEFASYKARLNVVYAFLTVIIVALIGLAIDVMAGGAP